METRNQTRALTPIRYNVNHMHVLIVFPANIPRNFYWWSDDQSLYIFTFWNVQAYNHDDLMFLIHAVFSTGTHSPTWEGLAGESKSNMHGPYW